VIQGFFFGSPCSGSTTPAFGVGFFLPAAAFLSRRSGVEPVRVLFLSLAAYWSLGFLPLHEFDPWRPLGWLSFGDSFFWHSWVLICDGYEVVTLRRF